MKILKKILAPLVLVVAFTAATVALGGTPAAPTAAPKAAAGVDWWSINPLFTGSGYENGAILEATWGPHYAVRVWIHCADNRYYYGQWVTYAGGHSSMRCPGYQVVTYPYHGASYSG